MDKDLKALMDRIQEKIKLTGPKERASYHCNVCKDLGYTFRTEGIYEIATKCKCQILKEIKGKMDNSGLGDLLETKTFGNYRADQEYQRVIKETAIKYTKEFLRGNKHSFSILGQSGIGKTHVMAAVARKLIDENISVKYYIADEIIQSLQACKYDDENYYREFSKIANAGVLFIDDLFKSSIQNYYNQETINMEHLREIFKIINYRYNKKLPILISSEIHFERFADLDQAVIGRINEMCNYEYLISIKPDPSKNYRLTKIEGC